MFVLSFCRVSHYPLNISSVDDMMVHFWYRAKIFWYILFSQRGLQFLLHFHLQCFVLLLTCVNIIYISPFETLLRAQVQMKTLLMWRSGVPCGDEPCTFCLHSSHTG